ncbi:MAG TPA: hypothetical protein VM144_18010 [Aestuariivirga sp.]|nr:hypothetical protein [Aestuariivirga sp.]
MIQDRSTETRVDQILGQAMCLAFGIWLILAIAMVFLTTLGTDEAWVLNGLKSLLLPWTPDASSEPISTNGGLFALVNLVLEFMLGSIVWVHRLFSLACLLALVGVLLFRWPGPPLKMQFRILFVAPLLGLPGTAEIGTTALGTSTAVLLVFLAAGAWTSSDRPGAGRILACGLLFGLGAASRFDLVLFAPALFLAECLRIYRDKLKYATIARTLAVIGIGLAIFAANQILLSPSAYPSTPENGFQRLLGTTGIASSFLNYPFILNRISLSIGFFPPVLIAICLAGFIWRQRAGESVADSLKAERFRALLFIIGIVLWTSWMLRSPIPHLRYIWPALACFAILLGFLLVQLLRDALKSGEWKKVVFCQITALALIITGIAGSTRNIVMGETNYMSWEWSGEMSRDYFRRFQHVQDQIAAFDYVKNQIPADATILSYVPFGLRYKTGRPILNAITELPDAANGRKFYLVLPPDVGTYLYLDAGSYGWITENSDLRAQFGRYSIYELRTLPPAGSDLLNLARTNYVGHPLSKNWFGR